MDVEKQLTVILNNSGMLITDDEIKNASASLMGAAFTAGGAIVGVIIGGKEGAAAGSAAGHYGGRAILGIVKKVFDNGSAAITYIGISSSIETFEKYFEQSGFMRAYKEGDANVYATRYVTPFGKRSWDGWTRYPYIRKISNMGDIGKVEPSITDQQIIDWCEWVAKEPAR